jgi:hypothetical protein
VSEKVKRTKKDEKPQIEEVLASRDEAHSAGRELVVSRSLKVGRADDPEEGQADRMADLALRHLNSGVSASTVGVSRSLKVGRADDPEEGQADRMAELALRKISGSENANTALRKSSIDDPLGGTAVDSSVESQIQSKLGSGSSLRDREASGFSNAYGVDLSGVRIHNDSVADELNRSLQADAFTVGSDVFFRGGLYQPGTGAGDHLLGHELAHVAIQSGHGLERMRSKVEAKRSESAGRHGPVDILRNATAGHVPEIRRTKEDGDQANADDSGAEKSKKKRRNAISIPNLMTLEEFTKQTKGNWPAHWYENASDVLKQKLKAYHEKKTADSQMSQDARYKILHEIQVIAESYISKRTVEMSKKNGDEEGGTLNADGKDAKIAAISALGKQAASAKKALEAAGFLKSSAKDLEASANEDKKVIKMKEKYDPQTAGTFFAGLGNTIDLLAGDPGASKEIEIKVMFMVAPATYVGVVIVVKADQDFNNGKGGPIHADLELKGRLEIGADLGLIKLEAGIDLGFFLEAQAVDGKQLGSWLSLGAYDNFRSLLPESTVNYLWFGSGGENFNKAKADEWMARIDKAVNDYPEENDEKYKAKKGESKEAATERDNALAIDRQAWAEQAQETYVRAGLVGGVSASAKVKNLQGKVQGSLSAQAKARGGTTISAASLHEYVESDDHDRSYSKKFRSWEVETEFVAAGWSGVYKFGQNYNGGEKREYLEGEFKIPAAWPVSSALNLLSGLSRSARIEASKKDKAKDAATEVGLTAVLDTKKIYDFFTQTDAAQKARKDAAEAATEAAAARDLRLDNIPGYDSVGEAAEDIASAAKDKVVAGASKVAADIGKAITPEDEAGFGNLGGGVVFKVKIEEKSPDVYEVRLIMATQGNTDVETPDALVKVGLKTKVSQTFFDAKVQVP